MIYVQPLTYAYNAMVHWSPILTPFSVVLSNHPREPTTFDNLTSLATDTTATTSLHALRAQFLHLIAPMWQGTDKRMKWSQWLYEDDHDWKFPNFPLLFTVKQYFYLYCQAMTTSAAERLKFKSYNNLLSVKKGPFKVIQVPLTTLRLKTTEYEILYRSTEINWHHWRLAQSIKTNTSPTKWVTNETTKSTQMNYILLTGLLREYAVHHIGRHIDEFDTVRYVVRWYSYTSAYDKVKPPENTSQRFITWYWRGMQKTEAVGQQWRIEHINRKRRYESNQHYVKESSVEDEVSDYLPMVRQKTIQ